jgi:Protein of unknown function (DUF4079)
VLADCITHISSWRFTIQSCLVFCCQERKKLIGQKLNEKHNNWGSLILGLGVTMAVAGPLNTFLRTGKLFPGPHLYAGAAITVLWALAAALVPQMQKGNETARSLHIAANTVNILLFAWQIPTGLEIVWKVSVRRCTWACSEG